MKCPHCGKTINTSTIAAELGSKGGSAISDAKAEAARKNGLKGGRPTNRERRERGTRT